MLSHAAPERHARGLGHRRRLPSVLSMHPIFILGPTGCGKSRLAVELAEALGNAEIVSADAYQVYRQLPILTAAPGAELRKRALHHLIGIMDVTENNDAAVHARRAIAAIEDIEARGRRAIVTGGSGLYVKFISHGISPAPPSDPTLRAELDALPAEEAVARLQALDPEGAARTNLQNPRYVRRNLEIVILGGKPLAYWQQNWQKPPAGPGFMLTRDTAELDARIARRAHKMISAGLVNEVAALGTLSATAAKTLGLSLVRSHLAGELTLPQMLNTLALTTRQYAKRQRTWLRRETWLQPINMNDTAVHEILRRLDA